MTKSALVCGAGGFIGSHLVRRLKADGYWVRSVDLKAPEFSESHADSFLIGDLRDPAFCADILCVPYDEIYQLAADMGGAGYLFTGEHDAEVMTNSALINLNVLRSIETGPIHRPRVFFASSACVYPERNQQDPRAPDCEESTVYPAEPDSEYGWEKLFAERLYLAHARQLGLEVRIGRYHNVFGPEGTWRGGREKAPAAICRKVAEARNGSEIEIWGTGAQTRSFLYIDEAVEATVRLMRSSFTGPVNIGSTEMVSINRLAELAMGVAGKQLKLRHVAGPIGVTGRASDNRLIYEKLGWMPTDWLVDGLGATYWWIAHQVEMASQMERAT